MIAKRMIINGLLPPSLLPSYDTKPWEVKAIDTKEIWQYGAYTSIGSLDLMCACLDIPTPKDGEVNGGMVHEAYWNQNRLKEIAEYCEKDVNVLIDTIMKLGMAHPMGPLQLADFIGLDVCLAILNVMYDGFKNPKYAPCPLLVNMVRAGKLGVKSGEGFYDYSESKKAEKVARMFSK